MQKLQKLVLPDSLPNPFFSPLPNLTNSLFEGTYAHRHTKLSEIFLTAHKREQKQNCALQDGIGKK